MGQYYDWVNLETGENLNPSDFENFTGNKLFESSWVDCDILNALYTLLGSDWKGKKVGFIGDESTRENWSQYIDLSLYPKFKFDDAGNVGEVKDVSYQFQRTEYTLSDLEDSHYTEEETKNVGKRDYVFYRYVINKDKKVYLDRNDPVFEERDIFPILMAVSGRELQDKVQGMWVGDLIEVSNDKPSDKYNNVDKELFKLFNEEC